MPAAPAITTRISRRFAELQRRGEMGVVPYITAGDPSFAASLKFVLALAEAGADVIELGVPFSDPLADGPTIQRASERAVKSGATLAGVLDLVREIRTTSDVPLVLFSYYNPILQMGLEKFASAASEAGADGVLATDLTPEESVDYRRILHSHNLDTIFLGAPTSTDERLAQIASVSSGFLYLISRTGVTGAKDSLPDDLPALIRRARGVYAIADCCRFRDFTAWPRFRSWRARRCRRYRLRTCFRNRKRLIRRICRLALAARIRSLNMRAVRPFEKGSGVMTLSDWRRRIDELDRKLVELLNERSRCALEIGKLKQQQKSAALPTGPRERKFLENAERNNRGPLTDAAIRRLFERIIDEARAAERSAMHPTERRKMHDRIARDFFVLSF